MDISRLPPWHGKVLNAVIETPKGSRNKYEYDGKLGLFKLSGMLPSGAVFPFDFGFIPSTLGQDGDPLDVLVLLDTPVVTGCLVESRLLGAIEAEQTEGKDTFRNDRLIAVSIHSRDHQHVTRLEQINPQFLEDIEHFFASYNTAKGKHFRVLGRCGPRRAANLIKAAM